MDASKFRLLQAIAVCLLVHLGGSVEGKEFNVYWNVPTFMCAHRGIHIDASKFGIIQNTDDEFQGEKVTIWYHPGTFPYLNGNESVNGGIPQLGNLAEHINVFTEQVDKEMPEDFNGPAVLDFEHYLPSLARSPKEYRRASHDWVASEHPTWTEEEIQAESERGFDAATRDFMEVLLHVGAELRPNGLWGYYHYPYCKNHKGVKECGAGMTEMNDHTLWIYEGSRATYPSIYLLEADSMEGRNNMVMGRIDEAKRMNSLTGSDMNIYTYCWYRYHENLTYITPEDILNTVGVSKVEGLDGSVLWGGSGDLDTKDKCLEFQAYLNDILGPMIQDILELPESVLRTLLRNKGIY